MKARFMRVSHKILWNGLQDLCSALAVCEGYCELLGRRYVQCLRWFIINLPSGGSM